MRLTKCSANTQPVRVCFVIDKLSRAGTEMQLVALLNKLNREIVDPSLCLLDGSDCQSQLLQPSSCPVIDLGLKKLATSAAMPAAAKLASFWRRQRTQIVQTYFLDSTYFAAPLARLIGIRHVVRVRNNSGYWLTRKHRLLGRLVGQLGTTLTNSDDARRALLEVERTCTNDIAVIENGVDLERFPQAPPPDTSRRQVRVGAVANLRAVKNIDGLIRVATAMVADYPHMQFEVAGEGNQRPSLEEQIKRAGLSGRFVLRGKVDDIPAFLAQLDIAVLCSHSESMSNALLEYMAAGRAIVATDVGANAKLIQHECEGLVVSPGDDLALEGAIRTYLANPKQAENHGNSARVKVIARYSRDSMVRRFEAYFTQLAQNKGPRRRREPN